MVRSHDTNDGAPADRPRRAATTSPWPIPTIRAMAFFDRLRRLRHAGDVGLRRLRGDLHLLARARRGGGRRRVRGPRPPPALRGGPAAGAAPRAPHRLSPAPGIGDGAERLPPAGRCRKDGVVPATLRPPGASPTVDDLIAVGRRHGLDAVGVAPAAPFATTRRHLERRRAAGLHGGMQFTYRRPERSTDPGRPCPAPGPSWSAPAATAGPASADPPEPAAAGSRSARRRPGVGSPATPGTTTTRRCGRR